MATLEIDAPPGAGALGIALIQDEPTADVDCSVEALVGSAWHVISSKRVASPSADPQGRGNSRAVCVVDYPNAGRYRITATPSAGAVTIKASAGKFAGAFMQLSDFGNGVASWLA